ncbi:MAG: polyprenyl diphosphate synthase [Candidatus Pacebacteria bacterium]|nr:polyprenyl diphosphate synthase [Candidatus Paceibacterota bacterium]
MSKIPNHVAVIPDGNRRWAKKRGLPSIIGHQKGVDALESILDKFLEMKIPYFTFWGSSMDNITNRTKKEVSYLFDIFENQFKRIADHKRIHKNKVKIIVLGRWEELFPETTKKAIKEAIEKTKNYDKHVLTFLMAYNGDDEMIECIKTIKKKGIAVNSQTIKDNLWTKDLPSVDFVIRTGCDKDPHNSAGFMMWDTTYSQLFFTDKLFPDFKEKEFEKTINDYMERERRMGK